MKRLLTFIALCLMAACRTDYHCNCYQHGSTVTDTTVDLGAISNDNAQQNCARVKTLKPADSCALYGLGWH